jgi:Cu/Zn superoxide dismutase
MRGYQQLTCVVAAAGLLAGCASSGNTVGMMKTYHATLSGAQEVPATNSSAQGSAEFTVDPDSRKVTWNVTYSGLTGPAMAAHIHGPAAPGATAGVVVNIAAAGTGSPIQGSAVLTDAQMADLMAGKDYVNIHTAQNKGGEIRGQITP